MNAEKCLLILREIKDVAFATVDECGKPQIRIIDIMLVDSEKLYFCTARGKSFYHQLIKDSNVAIILVAVITIISIIPGGKKETINIATKPMTE